MLYAQIDLSYIKQSEVSASTLTRVRRMAG